MTRYDEGWNPARVNIDTINTDPLGVGDGHVWRCWEWGLEGSSTYFHPRLPRGKTHAHPARDVVVPVWRAACITLGPGLSLQALELRP